MMVVLAAHKLVFILSLERADLKGPKARVSKRRWRRGCSGNRTTRYSVRIPAGKVSEMGWRMSAVIAALVAAQQL
jgi:hypothetical protein